MFVSSFHPAARKLTLTPAARRDYRTQDLNINSSVMGPAQRGKKIFTHICNIVIIIYSNLFSHINNVSFVVKQNEES